MIEYLSITVSYLIWSLKNDDGGCADSSVTTAV
jgi:hypothetical protein